jgi:hypothetical protein
MPFESLPKELTLPNEAAYPPSELFLFDRHTRATFLAAHGEQAAPWDKERRIKRWTDTSVLEGVDPLDLLTTIVGYEYFDRVTRTYKALTMSVWEASMSNLPGKYVYPKYVVYPTPAVVAGPDGSQPLSSEIICFKVLAKGIAEELGGHVIESTSFSEGPFTIDWKDELRRRWLIVFPNITCNAAALLRLRHSHGVGAPGEWTWVKVGPYKEPRWISHQQLTGDHDPRPEIPIPCRQLFPVEAIFVGLGGVSTIYRTDMESPYNSAPQASGGGGLTTKQARQQTTILERVLAICKQFNID